ncbi:hypothetical protein [Kutzneria kofuensis]|uniref:Uncharacterized protein n=1 Tax=Kutzneria kofuensis TaxID=103725 RepID=A0A7W9KI92_9PSEU|nr:hypothetical protein [Kutzneria kofuensis]MBB5893102.1 hypothetical protein [Kutzneria kofuensis]
MTPPRAVDVARWLWVAGALLSAVRSFLVLADRQGLRDQVRQVDPSLTMQQIEAAVNGEIILGVLFSAAVVALYVLVANKMRAGRAWARVLLTFFGVIFVVLGGLGLIGLADGLATAQGLSVDPVEVALSAVGLVVDVAALVAMWLRPSNDYFRASSVRFAMPPRQEQFPR